MGKRTEIYIPFDKALDLMCDIINSKIGVTTDHIGAPYKPVITVKQTEQMAAAVLRKHAAWVARANRIKA
jgi:hypothetical protein